MQHVSSASDSERNVNTHWPDGPARAVNGHVSGGILNKGLKMSVWVKVSMFSPVINVLSLSLLYPRRGTRALMLLVSQNDAIWCNNYIVSMSCAHCDCILSDYHENLVSHIFVDILKTSHNWWWHMVITTFYTGGIYHTSTEAKISVAPSTSLVWFKSQHGSVIISIIKCGTKLLQFLKFNGCNFIPRFTRQVITYPCWD